MGRKRETETPRWLVLMNERREERETERDITETRKRVLIH